MSTERSEEKKHLRTSRLSQGGEGVKVTRLREPGGAFGGNGRDKKGDMSQAYRTGTPNENMKRTGGVARGRSRSRRRTNS